MRAGCRCHRLRDCTHASDRMSPHASLAVHFAERVMQEHIGRAQCVGTGQIADDGVEAEHGFDRIRLKPCVERVAG
jgi:hypothetical protein